MMMGAVVGGSDVSGFPMISFFPVGHGAHQLGQALRGVRLDSDTKHFFPQALLEVVVGRLGQRGRVLRRKGFLATGDVPGNPGIDTNARKEVGCRYHVQTGGMYDLTWMAEGAGRVDRLPPRIPQKAGSSSYVPAYSYQA